MKRVFCIILETIGCNIWGREEADFILKRVLFETYYLTKYQQIFKAIHKLYLRHFRFPMCLHVPNAGLDNRFRYLL